jgi:thiamine biosynthesis lipoprotein
MTSARFPAFGTTAVVAATDASSIDRACAAVRDVIDAFDRACSRFREDSEISAVNAACGGVVRVSDLLLEAVQAALRAARLTGGDVDPTVGEALISLGYDRDFADLGAGRLPALARVPGWCWVRVDEGARTIRVPRGVKLDLGATAKALAADRAAGAAFAAAQCGVLVSLGGDIAIAGLAPAAGWRVRVTDDHAAGIEAPGQWLTLRSGGLATSSVTARRWHASDEQGREHSVHHLLDPATGRPAAGPWRTVSVAAASCLDANTASTAAIVRGERALDWLGEHGLPSRLVDHEGVARHIGGWPADGDDLGPSLRQLVPGSEVLV